jgi:hypothetical protein
VLVLGLGVVLVVLALLKRPPEKAEPPAEDQAA